MLPSRRMILAHFWLAFGGFGAALLLGEWQMFVRSPLHAWIGDPELYYRSVTAHGTTMAYVLSDPGRDGVRLLRDRGVACSARWLACAGHGRASPWSPSARSRPWSRSRWAEPRCCTPSTRR